MKMKTIEGVKKGTVNQFIKLCSCGGPASGKTHLAATFPKVVFAMTEPGGEDTFINKPDLAANIIGWDNFVPSCSKDIKDMYCEGGELDKFVDEVKNKALDKEIESFAMDNFTYYTDNNWLYIKEFEKHLYMSNKGNFDTLKAYGGLKDRLFLFTLQKLLTLPCHVITNVHIQLESEDAIDRKLDKSETVVPQILGGFRDKIKGMYSYVFYLDKKKDNATGKYKYFARTNLGNGKNAKSRLDLPEVIENVSYKTIKAEIDKVLGINQTK